MYKIKCIKCFYFSMRKFYHLIFKKTIKTFYVSQFYLAYNIIKIKKVRDKIIFVTMNDVVFNQSI